MIPLGVLLVMTAVARLKDMGVVTGLILVMFGMSTPAYRRWLVDRGLWMLAALMLTIWLALYVCIEIDALRGLGKALNPQRLRLAIDTTCAAFVVWQQVKFLATIIWVNRAISKPPVFDEAYARSQLESLQDDDTESSPT